MTLFDISNGLLVSIIIAESLTLQRAVRRMAALRRAASDARDRVQALPSGTVAPKFTAATVGGGIFASPADLMGSHSILLFLPALTSRESAVDAAIHAMLAKADGRLRIVCHGSASACTRFSQLYELKRRVVPTLIDESGAIAELFRLERLPSAIDFDGNAAILKYGRQIGGDRWPVRVSASQLGNVRATSI